MNLLPQTVLCETARVEEITDPALDRFLSTLRRAWWFVVLCTLLGGTLFAIRAGQTHFRSSGSVRYLDQSGPLDASKLPSDLISRTISLKADIEAVSSSSVDSEIAKTVGESVKVTTVLDTNAITGDVVSISVTSVTAPAADAALEEFVAKLRQRRSDQVRAAASKVVSSLDAQREADLQRIAVLDEQIRELGTSDISLSDAYRLERTKRSDELTTIDIQKSALDVYQAGADESVHFVHASPAKEVGGTLSGALLGGVLGAIFAVGCLAVYSHFDRRIRSGADLQIAGLKLLAVAGTEPDESASTAIASCLAAESDVFGCADFLFVVTNGANVDSLVSRVQADLTRMLPASSSSVVTGQSASSEGLIRLRTTPQVVFLVPWGRASISNISAEVKRFSLAGAKLVGGVLVAVPEKYKQSAFN